MDFYVCLLFSVVYFVSRNREYALKTAKKENVYKYKRNAKQQSYGSQIAFKSMVSIIS